LPANGTALDLACGVAANGLLMARQGLVVQLWDISDTALELQAGWFSQQGLEVVTERRDCERRPPGPASFDVICVAHFLHRPLCEALAAALKPGGLMFYQTFTANCSNGPTNPAFLLQPGELPALFGALTQRDYYELPVGEACFIGQRTR
jgi:SAM-dependent methyltransferase